MNSKKLDRPDICICYYIWDYCKSTKTILQTVFFCFYTEKSSWYFQNRLFSIRFIIFFKLLVHDKDINLSVKIRKINVKIIHSIRNEVFALKLLFFEIFRKGKRSQKILMKKKWELQKKCIKIEFNFHIFRCKIMQIFSHILKIQTFLNKMKYFLLKIGWNII